MSDGRTGAQLLVDALERYGVQRVAGNPGTTELAVLDAIADADLEYDLAQHEDVAVGMAAGYATVRRDHRNQRSDAASNAGGSDASNAEAPAESWATQPLGVANLHLFAGVAHGLGNLYDAWVAGAPLLVTAGTHSQSFRHEEPILSGDLLRHVEPYTKWAAEVRDVDALPATVRRAARTALTPPTGPVFLAIPTDVASATTDAEPEPLGPIPARGRGDPAALDAAAELLAGAEDVVLLVGDGVARAGPPGVDAAIEFAEAAGARVHGEALAAAVSFPSEHELWASVLPPNGDAMRAHLDADVIVLAGCTTNAPLVAHDAPLVPGDTTLVHLGADPSQLGRRQPADAALAGDPASLLASLAERVGDRVPAEQTRRRRDAAAERAAAVREATRERTSGPGDRRESSDPGVAAEDRATAAADRTTATEDRATAAEDGAGATEDLPAGAESRPTAADLVDALQRVVPDALVIDEGISAKYALLARRDLERGDFHSTKGGCLGYGLSAAVGAALAEADRRTTAASEPRPVLAFVGDGSFAYYPQAIRAAVRAGVDLTVVVANNGGYRSVAAKAEDVLDDGADPVGLSFEEPIDAAASAEAHGATGRRVDCRDDLERSLSTAVERDGVALVDVRLASRA